MSLKLYAYSTVIKCIILKLHNPTPSKTVLSRLFHRAAQDGTKDRHVTLGIYGLIMKKYYTVIL